MLGIDVLEEQNFALLQGKQVEALRWLETAIGLGNENIPWFESDPNWTDMHSDPRFVELMNNIKNHRTDPGDRSAVHGAKAAIPIAGRKSERWPSPGAGREIPRHRRPASPCGAKFLRTHAPGRGQIHLRALRHLRWPQ